MREYESYIGGFQWLPDIPSHWRVLRAKYLFQEITDTGYTDLPLLSITNTNGIVPQSSTGRRNRMSEDATKYKRIQIGDLGYNLMNAFIGSLGISKYDGLISPAYAVCRPIVPMIGKYFEYLYKTPLYLQIFDNYSYGIMIERNRLYFDNFKRIETIVPPIEEQEKIVQYLDWKTSKVNHLINIKKRSIAETLQLKHSVISDAVIHGINPTVEMRFSGVKWLGNIPAHWKVVKLRQLLSPVSVKNHPELPLLSVTREQGVIIRNVESKEENHNYIPDDLSGYKVVRKGQFAMNKMKAWQGSYGISDYTGIVSPAYFIFDVNFDNLEYFHFAIRSKVYVNFFAQASDGIRVGQWDLRMDKMKEIPFIIPPAEEQIALVEHVHSLMPKYEALIEKLQQEVKTLEEYKAKLISDAVTGKIDVRNMDIPDYEFEEKLGESENVDESDDSTLDEEV